MKRNVVKKRVKNTGGRFRSYVLWGVIHNHLQIVPKPEGDGIKVEDGVNQRASTAPHR